MAQADQIELTRMQLIGNHQQRLGVAIAPVDGGDEVAGGRTGAGPAKLPPMTIV